MGIYLDNGTCVALSCESDVVHHREGSYTTSDDHSPVHHLSRGVDLGGPEAEEDDEKQVADSDGIVGDTQRALESPGSPCQAAVVGFVVVGRRVEYGQVRGLAIEVATYATPQKEPDSEEV